MLWKAVFVTQCRACLLSHLRVTPECGLVQMQTRLSWSNVYVAFSRCVVKEFFGVSGHRRLDVTIPANGADALPGRRRHCCLKCTQLRLIALPCSSHRCRLIALAAGGGRLTLSVDFAALLLITLLIRRQHSGSLSAPHGVCVVT